MSLLAGLRIKGNKLQEGRGGKNKVMTYLSSLSQADGLRFGENPNTEWKRRGDYLISCLLLLASVEEFAQETVFFVDRGLKYTGIY